MIRLVAVEVYPPHRENGGQSEAQGVASHPGSMACGSISSRLLSPEVDYDTQAVYAALPLKSIPRNDVRNWQALTLTVTRRSEWMFLCVACSANFGLGEFVISA